MGPRFLLWHAVKVGYLETFRNLDKVLKLARIPFLLALAAPSIVGFAYWVWAPKGILAELQTFGGFTEVIHLTRMAVVDCCFGIFALAMFRYRLLGWSSETDHVPLTIGKREMAFIGAAGLAMAIHLVLWTAIIYWQDWTFPLNVEAPTVVVSLAILVLLARVCFVLAAAAVRRADAMPAWPLEARTWGALILLLAATAGVFWTGGQSPQYLRYLGFAPDLNAFFWMGGHLDFGVARRAAETPQAA